MGRFPILEKRKVIQVVTLKIIIFFFFKKKGLENFFTIKATRPFFFKGKQKSQNLPLHDQILEAISQ